MKYLFIFILLVSASPIFSQNNAQANSSQWLESINAVSDSEKWDSIKERYFASTLANESDPILVVDGIYVHSASQRKYLNEVGFDEIKSINLMINEPEGWTADKKWQGIVLITLSKKAGRRFKRFTV